MVERNMYFGCVQVGGETVDSVEQGSDGESDYSVVPEELPVGGGGVVEAGAARDTVVFVKSLTNATITISVDPDEPVSRTGRAIEGHSLMSRVTRYRIIFGGKHWEDGKTPRDYNVQKESIVHMLWCVKFVPPPPPPHEFPRVYFRVG